MLLKTRIHFTQRPGRNNDTVSFCGQLIPDNLSFDGGYYKIYRADKSKITGAFLKVTCVECLTAVLIKRNSELMELGRRIDKLKKEEVS